MTAYGPSGHFVGGAMGSRATAIMMTPASRFGEKPNFGAGGGCDKGLNKGGETDSWRGRSTGNLFLFNHQRLPATTFVNGFIMVPRLSTKGLPMGVSDGEKWIAAENISRFQAKLAETKDEAERRTLLDLIEREREKLAKPRDQRT